MKILLHTVTRVISIVFLLSCLSANSFAALNGSYTINPSANASANNYKDFASAINDLKLGTRTDGGPVNGPGVSGAVTFNVSSGNYNTQISIPAINGVSSTNTITFDGGNAATTIIQSSTASPNFAVVTFDTCQFVTFEDFTITSTTAANQSNSYGVNFVGTKTSSCDNNELKNCIVNLIFQPYLTFSSRPACYGIFFNGSDSNSVIKGYFQNNTVDGCTVNNSFYGIYALGTLDSCAGNVFKNNIMNNYFSVGIYLNNSTGLKLLNNTLASDNIDVGLNSTYYFEGLFFNTAVILSGCGASRTDFTDISGNNVKMFFQYGININSCAGTSSQRTRISNNFVQRGFATIVGARRCYAMTIDRTDTSDIWNNTLDINFPVNSKLMAVFSDDGTSTDVNLQNNIFSFSSSAGLGSPFTSTALPANYTAFDYNIFYDADSVKTGVMDGITYITPQVGGLNVHSFDIKPKFKGSNDLHLQNYYGSKQGITGTVTTDIDGETRGNPPLIGADDFPPAANNDLSVDSLITPTLIINAGSQTISIHFTNVGANTVTSAMLRYSINGGAATSQAWSGSLASGTGTIFTFTASGNFVAGLNSLKVFSSLPNGSVDSYTKNDTLAIPIYTTLNGTYTINGAVAASVTNFISFTSAASGLNGGLVTGPVLINVTPGTYTEQIELDSINGTSSTNTVKFNGSDTSKVTLTWNGVFGSQHTIRLSGCKYVTFAHMTITGQNTSYAWPVHFIKDATDFNRLVNCLITVPTPTDDMNECPVMFGGSLGYVPPYTVPLLNIRYTDIDSCVIRGGKAGILFDGNADTVKCVGNLFRYNHITGVYNWGIWLLETNGAKVLNNVITPNYTHSGGIFISACRSSYNDFTDISDNMITNFGYDLQASEVTVDGAISLYSASGGAAGDFRVSNNMIGGMLTTSNGIFMNTCSHVDIVFNSVNYNHNGTLLPYNAALRDNSIGPNIIKDNIFAVTAINGEASCLFDSNDTTKVNSASDFDYNIFYNTANDNAAFFHSILYTPSTVIGGGGYNIHSQVMNPTFISPTNLHITSQSNLGISFNGVTTDIDGQTRASTPCIGADEINIGCTAPALAGVVIGPDSVCQGETNVTFSIPAISGSTGYTWSVPGGMTIISGGNTNSIVANFSALALNGAITVQGTNTCGSGSPSIPFSIQINTPPVLTPVTQNVNCNGYCNGAIAINAAGSGGFHYNWSTTDTTSTISGLCAGNYKVTVTDSLGCATTSSGTVGAPNVLTASVTQTPATCPTCQDGKASVTPSGGTPPYAYSWTSGANTANVSGLPAGKYSVCVTDSNGCGVCDTITVDYLLGINNLQNDAGISVYPNPSDGLFSIKMNMGNGKAIAELYNITGAKVYEEDLNTIEIYTINAGKYGKGIYILQIRSEHGVWQEKVVIQ